MCEANVFIKKDGKEEKVLEEVEILKAEGDVLFLANIHGEQKRLKARLVSIDFTEHKVLLAEE